MAIDPRISLATQAPTPVGDIFRGILQNIEEAQRQNIAGQIAPLQQEQAQLQTDLLRAQQPALLQQAEFASSPLTQAQRELTQEQQLGVQIAQSLKPLLDSNNDLGVVAELTKLNQQRPELGLTDEIELIQRDPQAFRAMNDSILQLGGAVTPEQKVSTRSFAPITDLKSGQVSIPTFDPNTQEAKLVPIEGAKQLTPTQKQQQELSQFTTKERKKARISRAKEIKKEIGDRNRNAARSQQPLFEALRLASNPRTAEGIGAGIATQLARVLPGIDVSNEGNLDSALNRLALEQLQNFKGPTTDFEFGVTQNIVGSLTDPREANIARLKSLQRANWFAKREFKQFSDFMDSNGDPDNFAFDFNETVSTKKGDFNLKDLQDTAVDNNMTIEEVIAELDK